MLDHYDRIPPHLRACPASRIGACATSAKCSPVVGSSRIYSVLPVLFLESSDASLIRCASPPESCVLGCPSLIYPSPTSSKVCSCSGYARDIFKENSSFFHVHIQHVINALVLVLYFQCLSVIASALADFTRHVNIRQKVHLDLYNAVAAAGFTPSAFNVKAEPSLAYSLAAFASGSLREQIRGSYQIRRYRSPDWNAASCPIGAWSMAMILSMLLDAVDAFMSCPEYVLARFTSLRQRVYIKFR